LSAKSTKFLIFSKSSPEKRPFFKDLERFFTKIVSFISEFEVLIEN